jgi:hypothetical protein
MPTSPTPSWKFAQGLAGSKFEPELSSKAEDWVTGTSAMPSTPAEKTAGMIKGFDLSEEQATAAAAAVFAAEERLGAEAMPMPAICARQAVSLMRLMADEDYLRQNYPDLPARVYNADMVSDAEIKMLDAPAGMALAALDPTSGDMERAKASVSRIGGDEQGEGFDGIAEMLVKNIDIDPTEHEMTVALSRAYAANRMFGDELDAKTAGTMIASSVFMQRQAGFMIDPERTDLEGEPAAAQKLAAENEAVRSEFAMQAKGDISNLSRGARLEMADDLVRGSFLPEMIHKAIDLVAGEQGIQSEPEKAATMPMPGPASMEM